MINRILFSFKSFNNSDQTEYFLFKSFNFRCHGEKECYLDPSLTEMELIKCQSRKTNFIFFTYRCFYSEHLNVFSVISVYFNGHGTGLQMYSIKLKSISHVNFRCKLHEYSFSESTAQCSSDGFCK